MDSFIVSIADGTGVKDSIKINVDIIVANVAPCCVTATGADEPGALAITVAEGATVATSIALWSLSLCSCSIIPGILFLRGGAELR